MKNFLIIITSDHGQLLGEYGRIGHGMYLYDELLTVPLFIRYPDELMLSHMEDYMENYISLSMLKQLVLNVVKSFSSRKVFSDKILYSDTVYSESYGTHIKIPSKNICIDRLENIENHRIKIYHKGKYAIFNINNWKFEDICGKMDDDIANLLRRKIINFLNFHLKMKNISKYSL